MAIAYTCDGCGAAVAEAEMKELGLVLKSQYCPTCAGLAEKFASDLSALHTKLAAEFASQRAALVFEFLQANPSFKELPDGALGFAPAPEASGP